VRAVVTLGLVGLVFAVFFAVLVFSYRQGLTW
jgi:hypothetical protein